MAPSPWRRRHKPRHARPRSPRLTSPCLTCLTDILDFVIGPAGHLLLLQPTGHWLNTAGNVSLLILRLVGHHCSHLPSKQLQ
jgi:hypothetical protein